MISNAFCHKKFTIFSEESILSGWVAWSHIVVINKKLVENIQVSEGLQETQLQDYALIKKRPHDQKKKKEKEKEEIIKIHKSNLYIFLLERF